MSKRPQLNFCCASWPWPRRRLRRAGPAEEVSLYTTREPAIQPLLDAFTKESGIKVNTVFGRPARAGQGRRRQVAGRR